MPIFAITTKEVPLKRSHISSLKKLEVTEDILQTATLFIETAALSVKTASLFIKTTALSAVFIESFSSFTGRTKKLPR